MSVYKIKEAANEIIFEGRVFKLSEIQSILQRAGKQLYDTVTCPNEVRYLLSDEAKNILRHAIDFNDFPKDNISG